MRSWPRAVACMALCLAPAAARGQGSNLGSYGTHFVPGAIAGKVTGAGGAPVSGARVETTAGHFTFTDGAGDYTLYVDAPGIYDVSASSGSSSSGPVAANVVMGATTTQNFSLCTSTSVVTQPAGKTVGMGQSATMSVVGAGSAPLSYQWYQGASGNTTTPIAGATASSYTTPALTATTQYWVRVSNACGQADSNTATISVLSTNVRRFDFGTTTSPVATGFTRVANNTAYTNALGYGWVSGTIASRDRASGGDLKRDFNFTALGTFEVAVANGTYDVALIMGDAIAAHEQMGVYFENVLLDTISTVANQFATRSFRVNVSDGKLTLTLDDLGGGDPNVVINALEIAADGGRKLDFGTASSPVQAGFTRVAENLAYNANRGYGWLSGLRFSRDRGGANALTRDFNFTALATFVVDLVPGVYTVTFTMGDAAAKHDSMGIFLEGVQVDSVTTNANQFVTKSYRVRLVDGQLTILLDDLGGADGNVVINGLEITRFAAFDFGTPTSPVAAGYTRVAHTTAYGASQGFGWLTGAISSRDRASGGDVHRDFCFTVEGVFGADLPNGAYVVSVLMGDATSKHDSMRLFLEGALVDTITTNAGQYATRSALVTVADGQLSVLVEDGGGTDPNAVINGLVITPALP